MRDPQCDLDAECPECGGTIHGNNDPRYGETWEEKCPECGWVDDYEPDYESMASGHRRYL